jgi:hypothetical protein
MWGRGDSQSAAALTASSAVWVSNWLRRLSSRIEQCAYRYPSSVSDHLKSSFLELLPETNHIIRAEGANHPSDHQRIS